MIDEGFKSAPSENVMRLFRIHRRTCPKPFQLIKINQDLI